MKKQTNYNSKFNNKSNDSGYTDRSKSSYTKKSASTKGYDANNKNKYKPKVKDFSKTQKAHYSAAYKESNSPVKALYHSFVYEEQKKRGKLLSYKEKKIKFSDAEKYAKQHEENKKSKDTFFPKALRNILYEQ